MISFFKRLFRIGSANAHSALDNLENPLKMTAQGIRELKENLDASLKSLAEVKALAIRNNREMQAHKQEADEYERKAMALLQRAQNGQMDMSEAERLAAEALTRREEKLKGYQVCAENKVKYDQSVASMETKIRQLRSQISQWENELKTLEARDKVSKATGKINKELANIDSSGTLAMLEKMKQRVEEQEALSEAYGDMADTSRSVDDEINKVLNDPTIKSADALADLKRRMGINAGGAPEQKIEIKETNDVTIKIEVDDKKANL